MKIPTYEDVVVPMGLEDAIALVRLGRNPNQFLAVACPIVNEPEAGIGVQIGQLQPPGTRILMLPVIMPAGIFKDISTSRLAVEGQESTRTDIRVFSQHAIPRVMFYVDKAAARGEVVALAESIQASSEKAVADMLASEDGLEEVDDSMMDEPGEVT
jgi:hypothetical protein